MARIKKMTIRFRTGQLNPVIEAMVKRTLSLLSQVTLRGIAWIGLSTLG